MTDVFKDIVQFSYVKDLFLNIVRDALDYDESKHKDLFKNLLYSMVQLFMRIRMISAVRNCNEKQRCKKYTKSKEKSLRQSLKKKLEKVYMSFLFEENGVYIFYKQPVY